jgi:Ring finger domain
MSTDNPCPICMDTLHGNRAVGCTVPCGHVFHRRCFETWQKHSSAGKCPCCMITLAGFIDKIHITLPEVQEEWVGDSSTLSLHRRIALTQQKCQRSAMMRHNARRKPISSSALCHDQDTNRDEAGVAGAQPYMSLNASLQRVPPHPVKAATLDKLDTSQRKPDGPSLSLLEDMPDRSRSLMDAVSSTDDWSDRVPNVAESIMQNIERVIREIQSPPLQVRVTKQQASFGSTQRFGQKPSS